MTKSERFRGPGDAELVLAGGILGLAAEGPEVQALLEKERFETVLLGIPFEDLDAIKQTAGQESTREFERDEGDDAYLRNLAKYGTVKVPPTDLYIAYDHATKSGAIIEAVDLGDEGHAEVFTQHVGVLELMRKSRRERKLEKLDLEEPDAEAFALSWDRKYNPSKAMRRVQLEREKWMAERITKLAPSGKRSFALVPLARWAGVRSELLARGWTASGKPL